MNDNPERRKGNQPVYDREFWERRANESRRKQGLPEDIPAASLREVGRYMREAMLSQRK